MARLVICNGKVEVTEIDSKNEKLHLFVYAKKHNLDQNDVRGCIMFSCSYLYNEGFLPDNIDDWSTMVGTDCDEVA